MTIKIIRDRNNHSGLIILHRLDPRSGDSKDDCQRHAAMLLWVGQTWDNTGTRDQAGKEVMSDDELL